MLRYPEYTYVKLHIILTLLLQALKWWHTYTGPVFSMVLFSYTVSYRSHATKRGRD